MNDSQKGGARLMKSEHKRRELAPLLAIFGILVGLALASLLLIFRNSGIVKECQQRRFSRHTEGQNSLMEDVCGLMSHRQHRRKDI